MVFSEAQAASVWPFLGLRTLRVWWRFRLRVPRAGYTGSGTLRIQSYMSCELRFVLYCAFGGEREGRLVFGSYFFHTFVTKA